MKNPTAYQDTTKLRVTGGTTSHLPETITARSDILGATMVQTDRE